MRGRDRQEGQEETAGLAVSTGETREAGGSRNMAPTGSMGSSVLLRRAAYFSPENASQDTFGFQFVNVPFGLSFHAQTCSV